MLTALLLPLLATSTPSLFPDDPVLRIDPRMLVQAAEVWAVTAGGAESLWPGWQTSKTPLLFYFPGEQEVLINHPSPPNGFVPYKGPLEIPGFDIMVRDGETTFDHDGQNTATSINGVDTLVVADSLSNFRQQLFGLLGDPRPFEDKLDGVTLGWMATDTYDQALMIAHEAFHVYQYSWAEDRFVSEGLLVGYPALSVENNTGFALEADILHEALSNLGNKPGLERAAIDLLAVRDWRRTFISEDSARYEDGTELNEGLAKYIEWALTLQLEGRTPAPEMYWTRDFRGYDDLGFLREQLLNGMRGFMNGEFVVNGDPYGTAGPRMRLYSSGMGIGALLDELDPSWKRTIEKENVSLTELLRRAVQPDAEELAEALADIHSSAEYKKFVDVKTELNKEGMRLAEVRVANILEGERPRVIIDYSALGHDIEAFGYTPFGITRVSGERVIYSMVTVSARIEAGYSVVQSAASDLLHDPKASRVAFVLPRGADVNTQLELLLAGAEGKDELSNVSVDLAGFALKAKSARARVEGDSLVIELL